MPEKSGQAGKSTYEMANRRGRQVVLMLVGGILVLLIIYFLLTNATQLGLGSGTVLALFVLLMVLPDLVKGKARKKEKEERRAIRGAKAEVKVEALLDGLDDGYLVLHDVASPYGNIDHIVISRDGGLFLVETKAHGGQVWAEDGRLLVNGRDPEKDFIAQCLRNAYWLRDEVATVTGAKSWVTPLLIFTNAFVRGRLTLKGVQVLNKKYLLPAIQGTKPHGGTSELWEKRDEVRERLVNKN